MNRELAKQKFEEQEEILDNISDILNLLNKICESDFVGDCANYLYILTNIMQKNMNKLDDIQFAIKHLCLD